MTVQENNVPVNSPKTVLTGLIALQNFLGDDLLENLKEGGDDALSKIIARLRTSIFNGPEKGSVAPSEIVEVLGSLLREAQLRYAKFPEFNVEDYQDSSIQASLEAYLEKLKDYINEYREDFDPKKEFDSEDEAVKYVKKCGIGNVKSVSLNPIHSTIVNIISDDNQPLTELQSINEKFAGLGNVGTVLISQDSVTFSSIEGSQIEGLGTLDENISGISGVWGTKYNISSGNVVSIYSKPNKNLTFTDKIGGFDLSRIDCVNTCEFDEQKRIKRIVFGEGVTGLEETGLDILSNDLSKSENVANVKVLGFAYDSNQVVVEYHNQYEAKFFKI